METLFFVFSKLAWGIVAPGNLLLLLLLAALVLLWRHRLRQTRILLAAVLGSALLIALLPVGEWLLYPLENRFPANPPLPRQVDGIVVLGGAQEARQSQAWGQPELNGAAERMTSFVMLSRHYPRARLLISGGSGLLTEQGIKEAALARDLLAALGVDPGRLLLEDASRNTAENARLSRELVSPARTDTWLLITSAAHMPRAVGAFCRQGWPVLPYPVDHQSVPGRLLRLEFAFTQHLAMLDTALREWLGLAAYVLSGRSDSVLWRQVSPVSCGAG